MAEMTTSQHLKLAKLVADKLNFPLDGFYFYTSGYWSKYHIGLGLKLNYN